MRLRTAHPLLPSPSRARRYDFSKKKCPGGTIASTPIGGSFAKSSGLGANAFNSRAARTLHVDIHGGNGRDGVTPAPGQYDVRPNRRMRGALMTA